ncbi:MAG TPA: aminomethyltransferase family protein [Burkholderiales bacterium]|jgi:aminomethyltransferase
MLKTTPFHERTAALCASHAWRRWAGYIVASSYELSHEREYHCIRAAAALFDVSPLYKYLIRGRDAVRLLDRVVTRDVTRCQVGQVLYTPWCEAAGKVLDDGTVARLDEAVFRMTSAEPSLRWLEANSIGLEVSVQDISESTAALSLQGPQSLAVLKALGDIPPLRYFRLARAELRGIQVEISRTGYTGDLGFEIWVPSSDALPVWDAVMEAGENHGLQAAGMLALDVARIEAGLMLIDVDYVPARKALVESQMSSPYELDLAWAVNLEKEQFVGRQALVDEKARGPAWQFVGIEIGYPGLERLYADVGLATRLPQAAWRTSVPIYSGAEQAGYATSGGWSPLLKKYIALAHLRSKWARPGTELDIEITVEHKRRRTAARVVKKPFFDPERKRG